MKWRSLPLIIALSAFNPAAFSADKPQVIIKDFKFIPQEITIKRGQAVNWLNREKRQYHSVWFEAQGEPEPEDYLFPDDTYEREFNQTGSFPYRCGPHPRMTGTVHVTE
ncbi:MAG: plastocyanin/azurin family copper-binding protein [Gammaproteobacteria bacterium]|nr:plastocyanin/azurin family copper-binding protein [Gammaproteobacteria bacterium]